MCATRSQGFLLVPVDPEIERAFRWRRLNFSMGDKSDHRLVVESVAAEVGHARAIVS